MRSLQFSSALTLGIAAFIVTGLPACVGDGDISSGETLDTSTSEGGDTSTSSVAVTTSGDDTSTTGPGTTTDGDATSSSSGADVTSSGDDSSSSSSSSSSSATSDSSSGGALECGPGTDLCGETCVVKALDPNNCGECGNACAAEEACDAGECVLECNGGSSKCEGSCVALATDPNNCGDCGVVCDAEQEVCAAGQCVSACGDGGLSKCGGDCVDTATDVLNCGECDNACEGTDACVAGQCTAQFAPKAVYTMSNDPSGNQILAFPRAADGTLSLSGTFTATGGKGTGAGLGNQHGLVFDAAQNLFFAVNAGDHSISMLSLELDGSLELLAHVPSGGERPISVTVAGSVVYALNAGIPANNTAGNISGFKIDGDTLTPIANSTRPLSAPNPNPAQIQFSPDGKALVVTEKGTNMLGVYTMSADLPTGPLTKVSSGQTPFGFDFSANSQVIVSEAWGGMAGLSSTSSYSLDAKGVLTTVSGAVPSTRTSACWLVVAGDYAYVANAMTNDITGYKVAADGKLSLLSANGVTAQAGKAPVDEDTTDDNDFLYVVNNGDHSFSIFQINADGSLTKQPDFVGLPSTASGVVAR